jgi:hypothetical protein
MCQMLIFRNGAVAVACTALLALSPMPLFSSLFSPFLERISSGGRCNSRTNRGTRMHLWWQYPQQAQTAGVCPQRSSSSKGGVQASRPGSKKAASLAWPRVSQSSESRSRPGILFGTPEIRQNPLWRRLVRNTWLLVLRFRVCPKPPVDFGHRGDGCRSHIWIVARKHAAQQVQRLLSAYIA